MDALPDAHPVGDEHAAARDGLGLESWVHASADLPDVVGMRSDAVLDALQIADPMGEQAASTDARRWLLIVRADEGLVGLAVQRRNETLVPAPISRDLWATTSAGRFRITRFPAADLLPGNDERALTVDQTHATIVVGETWAVKWQRRLAPSPTVARLRALGAARASGVIPADPLTPEPVGTVEWQAPDGSWLLVASAAEYLDGARDGWDWAVSLVRQACQQGEVDALAPFARIGLLVARMHASFAAVETGWADQEAIEHVRAGALADLERALGVVEGASRDRLRACEHLLRSEFERMSEVTGAPLIGLHGDLHVGQILLLPDDSLVVNDFDGNPVTPPAERLLPGPAARDVAGMLASIDHVARVVNHRTPGIDPSLAQAWIRPAQRAFLDAYRMELHRLGLAEILTEPWLRPFALQQECREYVYAALHLPHWHYVPDAVLADLLSDAGQPHPPSPWLPG